uniref:Myosin-1-like n=1 Tax=Dermatophagoides pteronyssinus TaxID=6956 RepID=A0A6P6Y9N0_DERPT
CKDLYEAVFNFIVKMVQRSFRRRKNEEDSLRSSRLTFTFPHYADKVVYNAKGFMASNLDFISTDLRSLLLQSKSPIIAAFFSAEKVGDRRKTIVSSFHAEMMSLMRRLAASACYFVRCIKPNNAQAPNVFDHALVTRQLMSGGVVPVLDIIRRGFPCRIPYAKMFVMYKQALKEQFACAFTPKELTKLLLQYMQLPPNAYKLGRTKSGFTQDMAELVKLIPRKAQKLLVTATVPPELRTLELEERVETVKQFHARQNNVLIGTEVAARGIDINNLAYVINYCMPASPRSYIHRCGRTARCDKSGTCISLLTAGNELRKGQLLNL